MTKREKHILEAAFSLFLRYGAKRTSMNDIAKEARIARQTLYNVFANKDAVLRATLKLFTERSIAEINARLTDCAALGDELDVVFEKLAISPYEMLHVSPNAEDLITGINAASRDEIAANDKAFRAVLEDIFAPHHENIASHGLTPQALAETAQIAATAAKEKALSRTHLEQLLSALKHVILAVAKAK